MSVYIWILLSLCKSQETIADWYVPKPALLACPSEFPVTSGSYSDCTFNNVTSLAFNVSLSGETLTLHSCAFIRCSDTESGGCIYSTATLQVSSCSFTSCRGGGGAIRVDNSNALSLIEDSLFDNCSSVSTGGAISFQRGKECRVNNSQFIDCVATTTGGAIRCIYSGNQYCSCSMEGCAFVRCIAALGENSANGGGGVECQAGTISISNCLFDLCSAEHSDGGAIALGLWHTHTSLYLNVTISGCEIRSCSSHEDAGGGISSYSPTLILSWVAITDCTAKSVYGQAIHFYSCKTFAWDHLCVKGTGTLVKTETSAIEIPALKEELEAACPSYAFTQRAHHYQSSHFVMFASMMTYILDP